MATDRPPILNKQVLLDLVAWRKSDLPPEAVRFAADLMLEAMADSLAEGREVCLRGFGRFIPRQYATAKKKKVGLLFHPSPRLRSKADDSDG